MPYRRVSDFFAQISSEDLLSLTELSIATGHIYTAAYQRSYVAEFLHWYESEGSRMFSKLLRCRTCVTVVECSRSLYVVARASRDLLYPALRKSLSNENSTHAHVLGGLKLNVEVCLILIDS